MRTNYTTKQFALFLKKRCADFDEDWRFAPKVGVESVTDGHLLAELEGVEKGAWFFFEAKSYGGSKDSCGVYVGPKRAVLVFPAPYGTDPSFEPRLRECLGL
jgi:hypothetical protein